MKKLPYLLFLCLSSGLFGDNPKIVENGRAPKGENITITFTEDLRFGPEEGGDEYLWPGSEVRIQVAANGHIFLIDPLQRRILEFDDKGTFVRLIGGPGEGPGEFPFLNSFTLLDDGRGIALGTSGPLSILHYFDEKLNFVKRRNNTSMEGLLNALVLAPNGVNKAGIVVSFSETEMWIKFGMLNDEFLIGEDHLLSEIPSMIFNPQRAGDPEFWVEFMADQFTQTAKGDGRVFVFDRNNHLYSGHMGHYVITKWDTAYKKLLVIKRDYTPVKISEEDIQAMIDPVQESLLSRLPPQLQQVVTPSVIKRAVEKAELPVHHLPVNGLLTMEDGKLIVIHRRDLTEGESTGDIFSSEGAYLGQFTFGGNGLERMIFANGKAYTVETDDLGDNFVVRYKVAEGPASK